MSIKVKVGGQEYTVSEEEKKVMEYFSGNYAITKLQAAEAVHFSIKLDLTRHY